MTKLKKIAYEVLIDRRRFIFPLDVFELCKDMNITLVKYSSLNDESRKLCLKRSDNGFYSFTPNNPVIFYNDMITTKANIRFTIAHEIKHYVCHDLEETDDVEILANHFAITLLCPKVLLVYYNITNLFQIMDYFDLSQDSARHVVDATQNRIFVHNNKIFKYENEYLAFFLENNK